MSLVIYLTFVTVLMLYDRNVDAGKAWKRIIYQSFGDCSDRPNDSLVITANNLFPRVRGPKIFINGNFTVKSNLPRELNVRFVLRTFEFI